MTFIYQNKAFDECYPVVCLTQNPDLRPFTNAGVICRKSVRTVRAPIYDAYYTQYKIENILISLHSRWTSWLSICDHHYASVRQFILFSKLWQIKQYVELCTLVLM